MIVQLLISLSVFAVCALTAPPSTVREKSSGVISVESADVLGRLEEFNSHHVEVQLKSMKFEPTEFFKFPVVIVDMHERVKQLNEEDKYSLKQIYYTLHSHILPSLRQRDNDIGADLSTIDYQFGIVCKDWKAAGFRTKNDDQCQEFIDMKNKLKVERVTIRKLVEKYAGISKELKQVNEEMKLTLQYFASYGLHIRNNGSSYIEKANIAQLLYILEHGDNGTGAKPWSDIQYILEAHPVTENPNFIMPVTEGKVYPGLIKLPY